MIEIKDKIIQNYWNQRSGSSKWLKLNIKSFKMIEIKVKIIENDSNQRSGSSKYWYQR